MGAYATVDEYRERSGDNDSRDDRVRACLDDLSDELDAECGVPDEGGLSGRAARLARSLVCDAARKALVAPSFRGVGTVSGATQASFSANGFSGSYQLQNPSGSAWFDRARLARLKRLLGRGQRVGVLRC